jgi:hypothetical protein
VHLSQQLNPRLAPAAEVADALVVRKPRRPGDAVNSRD